MKTKQRHVIKRQVIELKTPDQSGAQQIHSEVSRIYRHRLVPLIDRYCSEMSESDRLFRIDSMQLDLGSIDQRNLEQELVAKTELQLKKELSRHLNPDINGQQKKQPRKSAGRTPQLEILAWFAGTGTLPWWADGAGLEILEECLQKTAEQTPEQLAHLVSKLVKEDRPLRRIIHHFSDSHLLTLLAASVSLSGQNSLVKKQAEEFISLLLNTANTALLKRKPQSQIRRTVWRHVFNKLNEYSIKQYSTRLILQNTLINIAEELEVPIRDFRHHFRHLFPESFDAATQKRDTVSTDPTAPAEPLIALLNSCLQTPEQIAAEAIADRIRATLNKIRLAEEERNSTEKINYLRNTVDKGKLFLELKNALTENKLPQRIVDILTSRLTLTSDMLSEPLDSSAGSISIDALIDDAFSSGEEIYIDNAGLVLLWPFLPTFFSRLGFLTDKAFTNPEVQQRAVAILQFAATGDLRPPEFLLPLNKLLCGLEAASVFQTDAPLSVDETEKSDEFLTAVIANAPILNSMSIDGFRRAFIQRRGSLSERDGVHLLRVERETADIVLDQLSWRIGWIKFPWTTRPMQVEW